MKQRSIFLVMICLLVAGAVSAQDSIDPSADPLTGTIQLTDSDAMNPFFISLTTSGELDASELGEDCVGYVSSAPDLVIDWARESEFLRLFFFSNSDATLTIVTPDGEVLCNDDFNGTLLDPLVDVTSATQGLYSVYVGSVQENNRFPGFLVVTTLNAYNPAVVDLGALVPRATEDVDDPESEIPVSILQTAQEPLTGVTLDITTGFGDQTLEFAENGQIPLFDVATGNDLCTGFVESLPTVAFNWSGEGEQVHVYAEGDHDSSLMVYTPSGDFVCNDDTEIGGENLNPSVTFETPEEGRYVIYVGSFIPGETVSGTITITENVDAQPEPLNAEDIMGEGE